MVGGMARQEEEEEEEEEEGKIPSSKCLESLGEKRRRNKIINKIRRGRRRQQK